MWEVTTATVGLWTVAWWIAGVIVGMTAHRPGYAATLLDAVGRMANERDEACEYATRLLDDPTFYASERETIVATTAPGIPADAAMAMDDYRGED
jgi:hypothetical protein